MTFLLAANQTLAARYVYDPFGNTVSQTGSLAEANGYRFSSKEYHAASGLYYYLYRWYEPGMQRWMNRDPIGEAGGVNLHRIALNNTVNAIDPLGLWQFFFFLEGEVAYQWLGYDLSLYFVWDFSNNENNGVYWSYGPAMGITAGVGAGFGGSPTSIVGTSHTIDANCVKASPTLAIQPNPDFGSYSGALSGVGVSVGPGFGAAYSQTTTSPVLTSGQIQSWLRRWFF